MLSTASLNNQNKQHKAKKQTQSKHKASTKQAVMYVSVAGTEDAFEDEEQKIGKHTVC